MLELHDLCLLQIRHVIFNCILRITSVLHSILFYKSQVAFIKSCYEILSVVILLYLNESANLQRTLNSDGGRKRVNNWSMMSHWLPNANLINNNFIYVSGLPAAADPIRPSARIWHLTNLAPYHPPGKFIDASVQLCDTSISVEKRNEYHEKGHKSTFVILISIHELSSSTFQFHFYDIISNNSFSPFFNSSSLYKDKF